MEIMGDCHQLTLFGRQSARCVRALDGWEVYRILRYTVMDPHKDMCSYNTVISKHTNVIINNLCWKWDEKIIF